MEFYLHKHAIEIFTRVSHTALSLKKYTIQSKNEFAMTEEKFKSEVEILKKFFEIHCAKKHNTLLPYKQSFNYKTLHFSVELNLCEECRNLINYSFERLYE
ncbi:MAG: hypothetical protein CVV62_00130 [Tenericutes bacterium HGW-Tenericutes-7]|nr:MAG: hypothetical protein CVV62_00130 [Tenericutes bacterium HGW-Tenericutes-7]